MESTISPSARIYPQGTKASSHVNTSPNSEISRLLNEYKQKREDINSIEDEENWMTYVKDTLESEKLVNEWQRARFEYLSGQLQKRRPKIANNATIEHFRDCLNTADWKELNEDWKDVDGYLRIYGGTCIPLGVCNNFRLALCVNNNVIHPQEAGFKALVDHEVTTLNPKAIIGMRYHSLETHAQQTAIIVQFGGHSPLLYSRRCN